ncbi:carbohydrate ABC transporter permease [Naumannella halotolerans]|uniref:carbohydrate ABC transporter permease n=1 Tax=Naumannella halotolerans TaxID=993414 RepID=UPI00370D96CF
MPAIIGRTIIWVGVVVALTVLISLAMAQLLNKAFPGRRLVRMIVIIPWASSVVMTTMVVYYGLEGYIGIINQFFVDIGLLAEPYGWTRNALPAFCWSIAVAVFVSLPFTTYTLLAGLQTVPEDVLEAAQVDGAGRFSTYFRIVLPQLRSALAVAVLINIINVFNSLPILRVMTGSIPGYDADTIMTLIFKFLQRGDFALASALSVLGFGLVLVIVAIYVRAVRPLEDVR